MVQTNTTSLPTKKLLDQVRYKIRFKHYSLSTEKTYISWKYIIFNSKRHPTEISATEVETFLTYLETGISHHVSSSTQNQALSAILFLCREVLILGQVMCQRL